MKVLFLFLSLLSLNCFGQNQNIPLKHPRVMEMEDKLIEEASLYFSRRYPNEPFFAKIEVTPLRRNFEKNATSDSLPYFDQESEELVDEWDDPTTPISYLRNRIMRVTVHVSIPDKFDDLKIAEMKQELPIYLKLLPSRDEITIERKFKSAEEEVPKYVYYLLGALLFCSLLVGLMIRWSVSKMKPAAASGGSSAASYQAPSQTLSSKSKSSTHHGSTSVSGDVTFHDPTKTIEVVQLKIKQIKESKTFPTLKDMILLSDFAEKNPRSLGAIVYEFPNDWQKTIFQMGIDKSWLEAFSNPGQITPESIRLLEQMSRQRSFTAGDRDWEDLLIHVWRLGDKSHSFFKNMNQDHSFAILSLLPKSVSIGIAKKCFPGGWGRLLDSKPLSVVIESNILQSYSSRAIEIVPLYEWKMLEEYNKDKEILTYLNNVSIDDERDIYETLSKDSFIFKVRPAFYKTFELEVAELGKVATAFGLQDWALAVVNSSRTYIKLVADQLDDKKRVLFSSHLKYFDQNPPSIDDQGAIRQRIAEFVDINYFSNKNNLVGDMSGKEIKNDEQKAA